MAPLINPTNGHFVGGPESVKILGVQGVLCIWQLVFASRHRLKYQEKQQEDAKRVHDSWPWQKRQKKINISIDIPRENREKKRYREFENSAYGRLLILSMCANSGTKTNKTHSHGQGRWVGGDQ